MEKFHCMYPKFQEICEEKKKQNQKIQSQSKYQK